MTTLLGLMLAALGGIPIQPTSSAQEPPNPPASSSQNGVTKEEIEKFVRAQISDDAIIAYIRQHPPNPPICCNDLTELKAAGASNEVIRALIDVGAPQGQQPQDGGPSDAESQDYPYSEPPDYPSDSYPNSSYYYYYYPYYYPPPAFYFRDHDRDHDRQFEHSRRPPPARARPGDHAPGGARPGPETPHSPAPETPHGGGTPRGGHR